MEVHEIVRLVLLARWRRSKIEASDLDGDAGTKIRQARKRLDRPCTIIAVDR